MLFVSKSPELELVIRRDVPGVRMNMHNQAEHFSQVPVVYARFKPKALDFNQRLRADLRFKQINPTHPYGATPYRDGSIMGSQFAEEDISPQQPEPFVGYDPIHQLGRFDTATDIDAMGQPEDAAEIRRFVEEKMLTPLCGLNDLYILLDDVTLEKPWPSYPLEGQGRHKTIAATVKQLGLNPLDVIAFERAQEKPGVGVISELEALVAERVAEQDEQDALGAVIPG